METVTETLKNGATSDVENHVQVTMQTISEEVYGAINDAHDNQQKLIRDARAIRSGASCPEKGSR